MYSIEPNSPKARVSLRFDGVMKQDPERFFGELANAIGELSWGENGWDLLVDFTQTPVMPQDRAQNTAKIFAWCMENGVRRIALVSNSPTQKMQFRRVTGGSGVVRAFDDAAAAEAWLAA